MPAGGNQAAAYEDQVRGPVKAGQLADGIEKQNAAGRKRPGPVQYGAGLEGEPFPLDQLGDTRRAFGMARGQDQEALRVALHQLAVGGEDLCLLALVGARRGEDEAVGRDLVLLFDLRHKSSIGLDDRDVVLQVSRDVHRAGRRADLRDTAGIDGGLHTEGGEALQHGTEEPGEAEVAAEGAVGDAAVGQDHRDPHLARHADEVRPDLGLHDDHELGTGPIKDGADGEGVVEGEVDAEVGGLAFQGDAAAGLGDVGDDDILAGEAGADALQKRQRSVGLADRDGVHEDGAPLADQLQLFLGDAAEALEERGPSAPAQGAVGVVGDQQRQYQPEQQVVDDMDHLKPFFGSQAPPPGERKNWISMQGAKLLPPKGGGWEGGIRLNEPLRAPPPPPPPPSLTLPLRGREIGVSIRGLKLLHSGGGEIQIAPTVHRGNVRFGRSCVHLDVTLERHALAFPRWSVGTIQKL